MSFMTFFGYIVSRVARIPFLNCDPALAGEAMPSGNSVRVLRGAQKFCSFTLLKGFKMKTLNRILFLISAYIMGSIVGLTILTLRLLKRIEVINYKGIPQYGDNPKLFKNGLVIVSNHPSLLEPILIPGLFFNQYFFHPFKLSPWNVAEGKNYDNIFWRWAKERIIWVNREDSQGKRRTFRQVKQVVNNGGILILFPEGGRTFKRKTIESKKGKKLAFLQEGIGLLLLKTKAPVLFIWVEGSDKFFPNTLWVDENTSKFPFPRFWEKITVKIGDLVYFEKTSREKITQEIAAKLLELADK